MNITTYHPLKCKFSGSYPQWNNETKGFDINPCDECLRFDNKQIHRYDCNPDTGGNLSTYCGCFNRPESLLGIIMGEK